MRNLKSQEPQQFPLIKNSLKTLYTPSHFFQFPSTPTIAIPTKLHRPTRTPKPVQYLSPPQPLTLFLLIPLHLPALLILKTILSLPLLARTRKKQAHSRGSSPRVPGTACCSCRPHPYSISPSAPGNPAKKTALIGASRGSRERVRESFVRVHGGCARRDI